MYNDISNNTYQPTIPRDYIIFNKGGNVARIVPTFEFTDYCAYFYCLNKLQDYICDIKDRTQGTFGGWRFSNPIKEIENFEDLLMLDTIQYFPAAAIDIRAWLNEWNEYTRKAYSVFLDYQSKFGEDFYVAIFDIANFYDNIKVDLLEKRLRHKIPNTLSNELDLLMYFLHYWNKPFDGYFSRHTGIPQDEVGDCSRQLANFYLREFDKRIFNLTQASGSSYIRFADDMAIFSNDKYTAEKHIFEASKILYKIGLNINVGKVHIMKASEYRIYQAFDIISCLSDDTTKENFNSAVREFFDYKMKKYAFRSDRVIKRIITLLVKKGINFLENELLEPTITSILDETILADSPDFRLSNVYKIMKELNREDYYITLLDSMIKKTFHNSFHYHLLKFYKNINRSDFNFDMLQSEIENRKLKFGFY